MTGHFNALKASGSNTGCETTC